MTGLCRLCAETRPMEKMSEINDPVLNIEEKLIDCCRWARFEKLNLDADFPHHICIICMEKLEQCWLFAESVENAQHKLIEIIRFGKSVPFDPLNAIGQIGRKSDDDITDANMDILNGTLDQNQPIDNEANQMEYQPIEFVKGECKFDTVEMATTSAETFITIKKERNQRKTSSNTTNDAFEVNLNQVSFDENEGQQCGNFVDNFLRQVKSKERNDDGTINSDTIQRLGLINWMVLQHQCSICYVCFCSNYELKTHFISEHSNNALLYLCSMCNPKKHRTYRRRSILHRHIIRKHLPHLKYCCIKCNKFFWNLEKLSKHISNHTLRPYRDKFSLLCEECGRPFVSESALRSHAQTHLPAECKPIFECYMCKRSFVCKLSLRHHWPTHVGERKRFACNVCNKDFSRKDSLRRHQHQHVDVFPFVCVDCGKKFRYRKGLENHKNIHSGAKPYGCPICEYRCSDSSNVYKHIRQKHGMPPGHGLKIKHFTKNGIFDSNA